MLSMPAATATLALPVCIFMAAIQMASTPEQQRRSRVRAPTVSGQPASNRATRPALAHSPF